MATSFFGTLSGNIWLSEDGSRLIDSSGALFFTSPIPAQDLQSDGQLGGANSVDWAADSQVQQQIAVLTDPPGTSSNSQLQIYASNGLQFESQTEMPGFLYNSTSYISHGRYLFWNSAASKLFAILEADSSSGLLSDFAVYTIAAPESLPSCTWAVSPSSLNAPPSYSSWIFNVTSNCDWTPKSTGAGWLSSISGAGSGNGQFTLTVQNNMGGARSGSVIVGNQTITINQASSSCSYVLSASSASFSQFGGNGTVDLTTDSGCPWSIQSNSSWLTVTSSQSGTGPATVQFSASPAGTAAPQYGSLNIAGIAFYVGETGILQISPSQVRMSAPLGGFSSIRVTISNAGGVPITLASIITAAPFSVTAQGPLPATIAAGASLQVNLTYTPVSIRPAGGTLTLMTSAGSQTLPLSGTPEAIAAGSFSLAQGASVDFGPASLAMQSDGNLVLYRSDGMPLWSTGTFGQNCGANQCFAVFQGDGNFVVYNGRTPLWNSGTPGNPEAQLVFSAQSPQLEILGNQSILWTNVSSFSPGNFVLTQGQSINFGGRTLVMQGDGNLVLYQAGVALWNTGTFGQNCGADQCFAIFQGDGNFVVYNGRTPLWNSGTPGYPDAQLVFSAQSPQLEIVGNQSILWTSVSSFSPGNFVLAQGESISFGGRTLVMQGDGNLVLYQAGVPLWSTGTFGQNCDANQCFAIFQGDGNFVVYNGRTPLWNSGTPGYPDAQLVLSAQSPQLEILGNQSILWTNVSSFSPGNFVLTQGESINFGGRSLAMQGDGNLVLYQDGTALWNTGTFGQNCGADQCFAVFQGDGNFVVYNSGTPLWNSGTPGYPDAQFVLSAETPGIEIVGDRGALWTN